MPTLKITGTNAESDRHEKDVVTLLFHNGKLFSGAEDGKIKVWDENLKHIGEVQAHEVNVYSLAAMGNVLYTCSNDNTIKAWDIDTLKLKKIVFKASCEIIKLYVDSGKLYAGDEKGGVIIFQNDVVVNMLHVVEEVKDIIAKGKLLYTVRDLDVTVTEILNSDVGKFALKTNIEGRAPMVMIGDRLCVCTRDGKNMTVHNVKDTGSLQLFCTITGSELIIMAVAGMQLGDQYVLYSGGWDKIIKRWIVSGDKPLPGGCAIVPNIIQSICTGPQGQAYVGSAAGYICRLDLV